MQDRVAALNEDASVATLTRPRSPHFALLVALASASPFALNAITPAMPRMADDFGVSFAVIQLVLTTALLSFGLTQLFAGPLSDRFGRRPVIVAGLALYALGSFLSSLAPTITLLILGRILQAGGGASAFVLVRTIVHDTNDREAATRTISYMVMAMVLAPMLATYVGGVLTDSAGWRSILWLIAGIGAVLLVVVFATLKETNVLAGSTRTFQQIRDEARELMVLPLFWAYTAVAAFASGMFFSFLSVAPLLFEKVYGRTPAEFGQYFLLISIGYMAGNFTSARLTGKRGPVWMMGLGVALAAGGVAAFWLLRAWAHPLALFLPMTLLTFSNGVTLPSATVGAMSIRPRLAGTASGVGGAIQMLVASLVITVVGFLTSTGTMPVIIAMTLCWLLGWLSTAQLKRLAAAEPH